ncbi:MAG: SprT family zinc-dependent metalloprotease [Burkholderiales bacterium]
MADDITLAPQTETQRILLNGREVEFALKRSARRRSIGLKVDYSGLTVTAPPRASHRSIQRALVSQADWVLKKVEVWRKNTPPKIEWRQGALLPYIGGMIALNIVVLARRGEKSWQDLAGLNLVFSTPPSEEQVKGKVCDWYRGEAKRYFPQRVAHLANVAKIAQPRFFLSNAHARWGSCSSNGEIRLSWRLMKAPPDVIDYVAAHELAHLSHMDHSPRFWRRVGEIFPNYDTARNELRNNDALYRLF